MLAAIHAAVCCLTLVQIDVCANILTQVLQRTDKCIGALIDEFISRKSATSFGTPSCTEGCFSSPLLPPDTPYPHLLHDLVNFIADIQQLHATRGSRFGHQSIQLIAEIH